ncbi:MAG: ABC transporter permease [Oscillospiraceae bacterium]|nr:ABC transporter permease [Oscillospiraceae bacterium]
MFAQLRALYAYREMIRCLVQRNLRSRYKGSALGFLWTFASPLLQLGVYTFIFSHILKAPAEHYALSLFTALIPWLFFSASLTGGAGCVLAEKELVRKIWFPRAVLPAAYVTGSFINMLLCFLIVLAASSASGVRLHPGTLLLLPAVMLSEFLLALGISLLVSSVTVYFRDLEHILGILSMLWMYLTPVVYDISMIPARFRPLLQLNPMTALIGCYRDMLCGGTLPPPSALLYAAVQGVTVLLLGWCVFARLERRFAEVL